MDVLLHEDDFAALAYAYMKRVSTDGLVHTEVSDIDLLSEAGQC